MFDTHNDRQLALGYVGAVRLRRPWERRMDYGDEITDRAGDQHPLDWMRAALAVTHEQLKEMLSC